MTTFLDGVRLFQGVEKKGREVRPNVGDFVDVENPEGKGAKFQAAFARELFSMCDCPMILCPA
jgi:hypothetical protein